MGDILALEAVAIANPYCHGIVRLGHIGIEQTNGLSLILTSWTTLWSAKGFDLAPNLGYEFSA
jgi:hypothetical protein